MIDPERFGAAFIALTVLVAGFDLALAFLMRAQKEVSGSHE